MFGVFIKNYYQFSFTEFVFASIFVVLYILSFLIWGLFFEKPSEVVDRKKPLMWLKYKAFTKLIISSILMFVAVVFNLFWIISLPIGFVAFLLVISVLYTKIYNNEIIFLFFFISPLILGLLFAIFNQVELALYLVFIISLPLLILIIIGYPIYLFYLRIKRKS